MMVDHDTEPVFRTRVFLSDSYDVWDRHCRKEDNVWGTNRLCSKAVAVEATPINQPLIHLYHYNDGEQRSFRPASC